MHRRKIVVIAGSGRTGSTLLSLLLTQHRGVFNLGQLRDLWNAYADDAPCSCGHTLSACPVYSLAVPAALGPDVEAAITGLRTLARAFVADAGRLRDWDERPAIAGLATTHADFIGRLGRLLDAIQAAAGVDAFVDASKSPEMALALSLTEGSDVRVLNLVRDPRAVAVSWAQKRGFGAGLRYSRVWRDRQRILETWSRALGDAFLQVRYEDFARAPEQTIAAIQAWAGLPAEPGLFRAPGRASLSWARQHLFPPANETVLAERRSEVSITPSESWRAPRHRPLRLLSLLASYPGGSRYIQGGAGGVSGP